MAEKFDVQGFMQQLREAEAIKKKYANLRERYIEHGKQALTIKQALLNTIEQIDALAKNIDPALELSNAGGTRQRIDAQIWEDIVRALEKGMHITRNVITTMSPSLKESQIQSLLMRVSHLNNISKTKDGVNVRYYKNLAHDEPARENIA